MADTETLAPETDNPATQVTADTTAPVTAPETVLAAPDVAKDVAPDWASDWREKMAGGDEKELKRLARFQSPVDVYKSNRELEKKMSAGPAKLTADATPEQIAEYRKANGIPEKADGYLAALPKGLVIGDADKPIVEAFINRAHGKNAPPEVVADAIDWYYGEQERIATEQAAADKEFSLKSSDALREEWGAEFRGNINSITAFLDAAPAADDGTPLKDLMMNARLGDGTRLGDNPVALKWLARLAADANPAGFVSPSSGSSQIEGVTDEIAKIEGLMRTNRTAYNKDEKMQARYRQLLDAKEKLASR